MDRFLHSRDYRSILWRWLNTVDRLMLLSAMFAEGKMRDIVDRYIRAERYMTGDELLEQVVSGGTHVCSESVFKYIYTLRGYSGWSGRTSDLGRMGRIHKAPPVSVFHAALAGGTEYLNQYNDCAEGKYDELETHPRQYLTMCSCVREALGYCTRVGDYGLFLRLVRDHPLYDQIYKIISSCVDVGSACVGKPHTATTCNHVIQLYTLVLYLISVRAGPLMQRVMSWNVGDSVGGVDCIDGIGVFRSQDTFVRCMIEVAIFSDNTELFAKYWAIPHDRLRICIPVGSRGKILTQMIIDEEISIAEIHRLDRDAWLDAWTKMRELGLAVGGISWWNYDAMDYETNKKLICAGIIKHGRLIVGCPRKFLLNLKLLKSRDEALAREREANDNFNLEIVDIPEVYPLYLSKKNVRFSDFEECMRLLDIYGVTVHIDSDFEHECLMSNDHGRLVPYLRKYA